jgi:cytochrome c biogenesis protein CcdA
MDNLNDIKAIWLTSKTDSLPTSAEIVEMAKQYRNKGLRKKVLLIAAAIAFTALEVLVIFIYKSTMITTRIGEGLIIAAGLVLVATNIRSIGRFYRFTDYTNKEFIQFLEQTRINQLRYHKKTQVIGLSLSSMGLLFYLFETACEKPVPGLILYLVMATFLLIMWFYIRPRNYRKQKAKLDEKIKRLEKIADQINTETK